jgi:hypothetical protein
LQDRSPKAVNNVLATLSVLLRAAPESELIEHCLVRFVYHPFRDGMQRSTISTPAFAFGLSRSADQPEERPGPDRGDDRTSGIGVAKTSHLGSARVLCRGEGGLQVGEIVEFSGFCRDRGDI